MSKIYNPRDGEPTQVRKHNERGNVIKVYTDEWDTDRGRFLRQVRLIVSEFPEVYTPHWRWAGSLEDKVVPQGKRNCRFEECVNPFCFS